MNRRIVEGWHRGSGGYGRYVRNSMDARGESESWQKVLSEALGKDKLNILDVGTGPGIMAFQLARLGHDVTGVDMAEGMLNEARKNAELYGLDVKFQTGDAENLPFEDGIFDAIVSRWVLWTLPDPESALKEWIRVVRPGGHVVYIDGNWTLDLEESLFRRVWKVIGRSITSVTEGNFKARREKKKEVKGEEPKQNDEPPVELWSAHVHRPEADLEILKKLGYGEGIDITYGIKKRTLKGLNYIKYGFWKDYFLINITKRD